MSATLTPTDMLAERGSTRRLGAYVVACVFDRAGAHAAFALGDGTVHIACPTQTGAWNCIEAHDGAVLSLAQDARADGFVTGGDDGGFRRISASGNIATLHEVPRKWVEQTASFFDGTNGLLACGIGRTVHLFNAAGTPEKQFDHPSTVTGIAFDTKGKRLAASHYNGASLWFTASKSQTPRVLEWKGSHTGVAIHPAGDAVVTAMQENSLHGWRLADGQHMRMSGYPAKTECMGFTKNGRYLASSGADAVVLWPFFGGGPMGKPPRELAQLPETLCTRVACHPRDEFLAAGYSTGVVVLADIATQKTVVVSQGGEGAITALAWSPNGAHLAYGTATGFAATIDLSAR